MRYCFLRFPNGVAKAITLSYDDGCIHDKKLVEIIDKYKIKATFNINTGFAKNENNWHLSLSEIKKNIKFGKHEIAVHGAYHIAEGNVSVINGIKDVLNCRKDLEKSFNTIIKGMAYPDTGITRLTNGITKDEIKNYLKGLGIVYSRTLDNGEYSCELPVDWLEWVPTIHHIDPKLMDCLNKFLNEETHKKYIAKQSPQLFYLWGHSFEFANNNNWNILEEFCKTAGMRSDIWYATNMEIYNYVNAYRSLEFNVENTLVHNPTLYTIWFEIDTKPYCVKSGETLKIV